MEELALLFLLLNLSHSFAQSPACERAPVHYFAGNLEDLLKNYELLQLQEDPHDYCDTKMMKRFVEAHLPSGNTDELSKQEMLSAADKYLEEEGEGGFVALPRKTFAEAVAKQGIMLPQGTDGSDSQLTFSEKVPSALDVIGSKEPCGLPDHPGDNEFATLEKDEGDAGEDDSALMKAAQKIGAPAICVETVALSSIPSCSAAFNRNVSAIKQRGVPPLISMPKLLNEMLNSGVYDRGLAIMAKKMAAKLKSPEKISGDVFSDLKDSYKKAGYNDRLAEKLTFDTMGMIATGGPAMSVRLGHIPFSGDRWPTVTALTTIAGLLPVLDYHSSKNRSLYSFPPGVEGRCNTSKSYHFWMTAYLARKEVANGTSPEVAAAAAFSVSKLYPILGNMTNRGGAGTLFLHRPFSPATMIVRADLAYASAGSVFGAGGRNLNVDEGLKSLIGASRALPKLSVEETQSAVQPWKLYGYSRFHQIFAPNEVFRNDMNNQKFSSPAALRADDREALKGVRKTQCPGK